MPRGCPVASLEERFLKRIDKEGPLVDLSLGNCWIWKGNLGNDGYGRLVKHVWGESLTHRWSYNHFKGGLTPEKMVRHKCDNRSCVNPTHLDIGESKDNVHDMLLRNNKACNRKIKVEEWETIKELRHTGCTYKNIASIYGVSRRTIEFICLNKRIEPSGRAGDA